MNYNANTSGRPSASGGPGGVRKPKRVSDVNAMGGPSATNQQPPQFVADPFAAPVVGNFGGPQQQPFHQQQQQQPDFVSFPAGGDPYADFGHQPSPPPAYQPGPPGPPGAHVPQQQPMQPQQQPQMFNPQSPLGVFQQPMVQNMAMQYGQQLADQGKQLVESQFEKYVPVTRLKYYFAVDNAYVLNKLRLLFFPFAHQNWSLRYDEDNPVQPRFDLNAPDLYIPTMAYITYVVLAGFVLGMQQRFTPEDLGKQSSTALAVLVLELLIYTIVLYVTQIPSTLKWLDLLAYAGYKFVAMTTCIVVGILFNGFGYWLALLYCNAALAFFMTRTLYTKLKSGAGAAGAANAYQQPMYDAYGNPLPGAMPPQQQQQQQHQDFNAARTRKLYFTGLLVSLQLLVTWWLTRHLIAPSDRQLI